MKKIHFVKLSFLATAVAVSLSGCSAMHSTYERPELAEYVFMHGSTQNLTLNEKTALEEGVSPKARDSVNATQGSSASNARVADRNEVGTLEPDFWVDLGDEHLKALIEEVLTQGGDYKTAVIKAQKALAQADLTATNLIPDLNADLGSGFSKDFAGGTSRKSANSTFKLSYELDLFGRLAAERKAQDYEASASVNDAMAARLSVAQETATLYWQLVYTKDLLRLDEANLSNAKQTLKIMTSRYTTGKVAKLELLQAQRDVVEQESILASDKSTLKKTISALNALRNAAPNADIATIDTLLGVKLPVVSLERGSELLRFRPDMRAAEERLKSALASKDVAKLNMYPQVSLSAGIATGSTSELYQFFKDPIGSIAGALSFPFINYYQNSLKIDLASLDYNSAEIKFISTYYLALSEVSQAQSDLNLSQKMLAHDQDKLTLLTQTTEIYQSRYEAGQVALKDYLEAKANERLAQKAVVKDLKDALDSTTVLIKAIGGI